MSEISKENNRTLKEKIILGSVQFGRSYGINNKDGVPDDNQLKGILDYAFNQGVKTIDCAEVYGNALSRIAHYHHESGNRFNIISKLKSPNDLDSAIANIRSVLEQLDILSFESMLLHDVEDYVKNPVSIGILEVLKQKGLSKTKGVSIYTNEQFAMAIEDENIDVIQLPFNLLDNESIRGALMTKAKAAGKTIHIRSVFLQGLFFKKKEELPNYFTSLRPALEAIAKISSDYKIPVSSLALAYVLQNPLIDGVIIGIDSQNQLHNNLEACSVYLPPDCVKRINLIKVEEPFLLNPSKWILK